ncbi:MAG: hypothetical protein MKZ58_06610, partial [Candidatus Poseidoniaceae archaeon]|nr:hypothetical protein [Candidatus Poseidoniaceae archaeon]
MAASVSQNGRFRAVFLSVIMVLMTQVGYTDNMDFSIGLNQDTESKDTGGSTPALTPSVEGADLMVGDLMDEITFQYDASAASGSGSNSNSGTYNGNGTAWMVKDINTGTSNNGGSMSAMYLEQDAVMGNEMYFFATDSTNGYELWKSDGTASGTVMVKDINSANGNSGHSDIGEFTQMGSTLYFRADDGTNGQELWKTDGPSSGTVMVKDINPGNAGGVDCHCLRA